jgi:uncharacterized membrane protein
MLKLTSVIIIISFGILVYTQALASLGDADPYTNRIIQIDDNNLTYQFSVHEYKIIDTKLDGNVSIIVPGLSNTAQSGKPVLPVHHFVVGIPPQGTVDINILEDRSIQLDGKYNIELSPAPKPLSNDFQPGGWAENPQNIENSELTLFPDKPAEVETIAWVRNQRIALITLYPFQYQPDTGFVFWHKELTVMLNFHQESVITRGMQDISVQASENPFDSALREMLINYEQARWWRSNNHEPAAGISSFTDGPRLRIDIEQDGLYRITYADLAAAGMNPDDLDPRSLRMTSQGQDISIYIFGEEDGIFDPGDYILFYGEKYRGDIMAEWYSDENTHWINFPRQYPDGTTVFWKPDYNSVMLEKYTNDNVYWLKVDDASNPPRIGMRDVTPGMAPTLTAYREVVRREEQLRRWDYHFTGEDTWFWDFVGDTLVRSYNVELSAISTEPFIASLRAEVVAFTYNDYASPDHHTQFWINNQIVPLDDAYWDGKSRYAINVDFSGSDLLEGENQLKFRIINDAISPPQIFFDWFELEYSRRFMAVNNQIRFPGEFEGVWKYVVTGFTMQDLLLYDITDPADPKMLVNYQVQPNGMEYEVIFEVNQQQGAKYLALGEILSPKLMRYYDPPDLKSSTNGADYILISPPDFLSSAQNLANYRASQGLRTLVLNIHDIYNEFNEGIQNPIAIKNFLRYAYENWQPPSPVYIILVGDGHWDIKGNNPTRYGNDPVFMPPNLGWVDPWQGEVDTINLLANIVGNDLLPDLLISRIPVNNLSEFDAVVEKIIQFETSEFSDWHLRNIFIADDTPDNAGNFPAMSEALIDDFIRPGYEPIRIFLDDYEDNGACGIPPYPGGPSCPNVNSTITETISGPGALFLNYIGHASVRNWAHEQILVYHPDDPGNPNDKYINDIASMNNAEQLPIVLSMDCLDGYWFHPQLKPSLSELFLRTEGRGGVGVFSPTGLGVATGHDALQRGFYSSIFDYGNWEFGAATLAAKLNLFTSGNYFDLIHTFTIFGDPALSIPNAYDIDVFPRTASLNGLTGTTVNYSIHLTNTGQLTDTYNISAQGIWTVTLPVTEVTLLSQGMITFPVMIEIPAGIPGGSYDLTNVQITSQGDRAKTTNTLLMITGDTYGVIVRPSFDSKMGLPGENLIYTLNITNTSNTTDTFDITVEESEWPVSPSQTSIGPLGSGNSETMHFTVTIPSDAQDWDQDTGIISFTSRADPDQSAYITLNSTARTHGVSCEPAISYAAGKAGTIVEYQVYIRNTGGYPDIFDVNTSSENGWMVTPEQNIIGPLNTGVQVPLKVVVNIPVNVVGGQVDNTILTVSSQSDITKQDMSSLITTVNVYGIRISPLLDQLSGEPGSIVTYTLSITNLSNIADTFVVTVSDYVWDTSTLSNEITLSSGQNVNIFVTVRIPDSAFNGQTDSVTITLVSKSDKDTQNSVSLKTTAQYQNLPLYLPLIIR